MEKPAWLVGSNVVDFCYGCEFFLDHCSKILVEEYSWYKFA